MGQSGGVTMKTQVYLLQVRSQRRKAPVDFYSTSESKKSQVNHHFSTTEIKVAQVDLLLLLDQDVKPSLYTNWGFIKQDKYFRCATYFSWREVYGILFYYNIEYNILE